MQRRSQELPHETLSTILADYGDDPTAALRNAAYHPTPIRRIDVELPPSAAALRASIHAAVLAEVEGAAAGGGSRPRGPDDLLGSSGSAVDLLESLLKQGRAGPAAAAGTSGRSDGNGGGGGAARASSLPAWLSSAAPGQQGAAAVNVRGSMLACESTFIFPSGVPQQQQQQQQGEDGRSAAASDDGGELGGTAAWLEQPGLGQRRVSSAPGYASSSAGERAR